VKTIDFEDDQVQAVLLCVDERLSVLKNRLAQQFDGSAAGTIRQQHNRRTYVAEYASLQAAYAKLSGGEWPGGR
jgi:hypothetical protein